MARTRGQKPVPVELKKIRGNPGKRALPDGPPLTLIPGHGKGPMDFEPPPMPQGLGERGQELWERAWRLARSYLAEIDAVILHMACEAADERQLRMSMIRLMDQKDVADIQAGKELDRPRAWRLHGMLNTTNRQLTEWLGMLAFSPTDRARLAFPEKHGANDPIAQVRARSAERQEGFRQRFGQPTG